MMKAFKIFRNLSLKKGLLILAVLAGGAFVALCVFNVMLGLSDYVKTSIVSYTLEALAVGEGSSSESKPLHCPNFKSDTNYNVGTASAPIRVTCCVNGARD